MEAVQVARRPEHRSVRARFSEENVLGASSALEILFPAGRTRIAATLFVEWLRAQGGQATKNAVSNFANLLQRGQTQWHNMPFRYSRRNFYLTVLRTLVSLGFVQRNVPVWNETRRQTMYVYARNLFDIPQKPPAVGFWRLAYYTCRKWNELFIERPELRAEPSV
jgi:hypothetical protein